jgi:hypothetical protein
LHVDEPHVVDGKFTTTCDVEVETTVHVDPTPHMSHGPLLPDAMNWTLGESNVAPVLVIVTLPPAVPTFVAFSSVGDDAGM